MFDLQSFVLCGIILAASRANAAVVSRNLNIINAQLSPDGFSRSVVSAEGVFPGPLITGNKGDNFQINVVNKLNDTTMRRATSIHWHGFFQAGTAEMDGPSFVNQCPIIPNNSFLYNFNVPGQAGTYWYHSHLSTQYCDGLRGPLVVYDPNDPQKSLYDIDDQTTVITLADWYHQTSTALFPNTNKAPPTPDSTLINGLGRFSGGSATSPLAVVPATPNKRHRFRIVSTSCFPAYTFSIDGHNLTVIEADGVAHQPVTVNSLQIFPGQRYSVIVTANQPVGNYWIRAAPNVGTNTFTGGLNSAILRYTGAAVANPTSTQTTGGLLNEASLIPLQNPGAPGKATPGGADVNLNLVIGRDAASRNLTVNGVAFVPPSVPVLLQILNGAVAAGSILPNGSVYSLPSNKVIEISLPGGGGHPFHLHGHNFDVVRVAGSSTYNFANPVRRDVVTTGGGGDNVTFRFTTNNPGPWFLHCHIDWHLEAGLAVVFAEDAADIKSANPANQDWSNLCPLYNANNPDTKFP
ncbi:Cu-oxidase-domain-containing protein [Rickenella mellea]|uniref:Cu-oxidase-domain-containing protein n=1 Tax=Rickenella mellea TaxID=50990 RepID=A0A4Y7QH88_9AGAM|nr:Cu-oxidase-domain-containing protein [Rickenella mellea]